MEDEQIKQNTDRLIKTRAEKLKYKEAKWNIETNQIKWKWINKNLSDKGNKINQKHIYENAKADVRIIYNIYVYISIYMYMYIIYIICRYIIKSGKITTDYLLL